jgi:hypothetical protein
MNGIPHSQNFESTLHLLKDPYHIIKNQTFRIISDALQTHLAGEIGKNESLNFRVEAHFHVKKMVNTFILRIIDGGF